MVKLYMLNIDIWMWWLHVLNYVVELLHANDGDIDGVWCRCLCRWIITWYICSWLLTCWIYACKMLKLKCGDCMYNIWDDYWWRLCVNICIIVESYVHAFMTDDDEFYIHIGDDYDVFVASWGDDLGDDWYHMHVGVMSKCITYIWWSC